MLVNVFLNDAAHGCTWDAEDRADAVQRTAMAVDWINAQAAGYGAAPQLICDRSEDGSDAALTRSYLLQSAIRGGENSEESTDFLRRWTPCASHWLQTAVWRPTVRGRSRFCSTCHQRYLLHDGPLCR